MNHAIFAGYLCEYLFTNYQSLAKIFATFAEMQNYYLFVLGDCFPRHTLYILFVCHDNESIAIK